MYVCTEFNISNVGNHNFNFTFPALLKTQTSFL